MNGLKGIASAVDFIGNLFNFVNNLANDLLGNPRGSQKAADDIVDAERAIVKCNDQIQLPTRDASLADKSAACVQKAMGKDYSVLAPKENGEFTSLNISRKDDSIIFDETISTACKIASPVEGPKCQNTSGRNHLMGSDQPYMDRARNRPNI